MVVVVVVVVVVVGVVDPGMVGGGCQNPWDNPGSPSEGMRLRQGELNRVPCMNCLAI